MVGKRREEHGNGDDSMDHDCRLAQAGRGRSRTRARERAEPSADAA